MEPWPSPQMIASNWWRKSMSTTGFFKSSMLWLETRALMSVRWRPIVGSGHARLTWKLSHRRHLSWPMKSITLIGDPAFPWFASLKRPPPHLNMCFGITMSAWSIMTLNVGSPWPQRLDGKRIPNSSSRRRTSQIRGITPVSHPVRSRHQYKSLSRARRSNHGSQVGLS